MTDQDDDSQRVWAELNGLAKDGLNLSLFGAPTDRGQQLAAFQQSCRDRMALGLVEYGDKSFTADPDHLVREVCQELEDVANWSFILHTRLKALQAAWEAPMPPTQGEPTQ